MAKILKIKQFNGTDWIEYILNNESGNNELNIQNGAGNGSVQTKSEEVDATGEYSIAFGGYTENHPEQKTEANGRNAFAAGGSVVANADNSAAFNRLTSSLQYGCFAAGGGTTAGMTEKEFNSFVEIKAKTDPDHYKIDPATGEHYVLFDGYTGRYGYKRYETYATAFGEKSKALGRASFATGLNNTTSETARYSFVTGSNNKVGYDQNGKVADVYSMSAFGDGNTVGAYFATVFGNENKNYGKSSSVVGWKNTNTGEMSLVIGATNNNKARYSLISGQNNNISGDYNFATGYSNTISKNYSATIGTGLTVESEMQVAVGRYNESMTGYYPFVVGVGKWNAKKTALTAKDNGTVQVYTAPIEENDVVRLKELNAVSNLLVYATDEDINALWA